MAARHPDDELLSAYVDRALSHKDAGAIAEHLDTCPDCAARMHLLRATSVAVASLPEEELPRPLDFGFLHDDAATAGDQRGFVARVIHGGAPTWLPTMVAAAAVLALVATWVPRFVPAAHGTQLATAGQAPGAANRGPQAFAEASPSGAAGGLAQDNASGSARSLGPAAAVAPSPAFAGAAQKTVIGPDGSTVTLLANPPNSASGQQVQLLLRIIGGPRGTDLASPGMEIFVGQGTAQRRLAGSEGINRTLKSGEELDLTVEWTAGAVSGPPAPGAYSLTGRVFLKGSGVVDVPLTFNVS